MNRISRIKTVAASLLLLVLSSGMSFGATYKIHPAIAETQEEFETIANSLKPGDELVLYGGGKGVNIVEGNVIWNAGEGIQVVSDAIIRNNIVFNCSSTGITTAPHAAVPHVRNVKIVNNTIVDNPRGVLFRRAKAESMVFANNAVYCPGSTAIDVAGINSSRSSANYVAGRLIDVTINGATFCDGGTIDAAFSNPAGHDYWPAPGSVLIGRANPDFAPELDFNHTKREPPFDVGAYEWEFTLKNPGWRIKEGFKANQ